jgi:hypothetical protein
VTQPLERALRIEATHLRDQARKVPAYESLLLCLAIAKECTARQLEAERVAREARLALQEGDVTYDPKGKR